MKKIGIIGGLGPESTLDYYKGIIDGFKSTFEQSGYPEITVESCDFKEALTYANQDNWQQVIALIAIKCEILSKAGCHFGAIASNTPHKVFADIQKATSLPLLSIIETVCDYAESNKYKKLLLLGTGFTMKADFYQQVFAKKKIELVVPSAKNIEYMHEKIFSELEFGIINPDTKQRFLSITNDEAEKHNCEGAIMGCTELPLVIKEYELEVAYLDSTAIHIKKIIEECKK